MYLSKIVISGFKSFLEKTIIELEQDKITVIVGPNGCGKSNIFDAVRWAIGEQSMKSLRSPSAEDIIFAGAQKAAAVNLAQVQLYFLNDEEKDLPKYGKISEIQISRKLFRDGNNQYSINQRSCRLLDVRTLLMDIGLSYAGYSFIEQGNVTQIVQSKPEEKRKIIEEAAGLMKFKTLKKESENKLGQARQNLERVEDQRLELEKQDKKLARQSKLAEEYTCVQGRLNLLKRQIIAYQYQEAQGALQDVMQKRQQFSFDATKQKITTVESFLENVEEQAEKNIQKVKSTEEFYLELDKQLHKIITEKQIKEQLFLESETWLSKQEEEKKTIVEKITEIQEELKQYQNLSQKEELVSLEKTKKEEKDKLLKLQEMLKPLIFKKNKLLKSYQELDRILAQKQSLIEFQIKELKTAERTETGEQKRKAVVAAEQEKNIQEHLLKNLKEKQKKLGLIKEQEHIDFKEKQTLYEKNKISQNNLQNNLLELKQKLAHKKEIFAFEDSLKLLQNYFSNNSELAAQEIGFIGILGDLVSVQKTAPRETFHFFDRFFSCVVFSHQKKLLQIVEILEKLQIHSLEMIFLDSLIPQFQKPSSEDSFITQLQFSGKLQKQENLKSFFSPITSFKTLPLKTEVNPFYSPNVFSSFPNLLEYKNTKSFTQSEKYLAHLGSLAAYQTQIDTTQKELDSLNYVMKKLQTDIQTQKKSLEILEVEIKQSQAEIFSANEKYWQLKNHYLNESKIVEQQKKLKQQREATQKQLFQEEKETSEMTKKRANLKKEIQLCETQEKEWKQKEQELLLKNKEVQEKLHLFLPQLEYSEKAKQRSESDLKFNQDLLKRKNQQIESFLKSIEDKQTQKEAAETIKQKEEQKMIAKKTWQSQKEISNSLEEQKKKKEEEYHLLTKKLAEEQTAYYESEAQISQFAERVKNFEEQLQEQFSTTADEVLRNFGEQNFDLSNAKEEMQKLQNKMPSFSQVNLGAKEEYQETHEKLTFLNEQKEDLQSSIESIASSIAEINKNSKGTFWDMYQKIDENFQTLFAIVFQGGNAKLVLTNEKNLLDTGVEIFAQPAGKRNQHLGLFSSGERSLIGLIFIFAVLSANPSVFCFLDEVDAALDMVNVSRIVAVIQEVSKTNQMVIITHNQKTILAGDIAIGVTMLQEGVSRVFSVDIQEKQKKMVHVS